MLIAPHFYNPDMYLVKEIVHIQCYCRLCVIIITCSFTFCMIELCIFYILMVNKYKYIKHK